jgi:hypothetical protein
LFLEKKRAPVSVYVFMRILAASLSLLVLAGASARAASAFTALQLLSTDQARNVAVIAGRDGTPEPERWHFLVHDAKSENGLREVVVTGANKTADRTISQFAESLTAGDVINPDAMKVDSSQVAQLARDFGAVNNFSVSAMHFELRKSGPEAVPLWTVTCLDVSGTELGKLIVSATRGTVILHPGFTKEPAVNPAMMAARATPAPLGVGETNPNLDPLIDTPVKKTPPKKRTTPPPVATPKAGFFQRVFGGQNSPPNQPPKR